MAFNSSLLKATDSSSTGIELQSIVKNIDTRPPIYNYLEFNSDIQDIDLSSKIAQYRLLVEGVYLEDNNQPLDSINEGVVSNIFDKLQKLIQHIMHFIQEALKKVKLFFKSKTMTNPIVDDSAEVYAKNANKKREIEDRLNMVYEGYEMSYHGNTIAGILSTYRKELNQYLRYLIDSRILDDYDPSSVYNKAWKTICQRIPEAVNHDVSDSTEFNKLCSELLSANKVKKTNREWLELYKKRDANNGWIRLITVMEASIEEARKDYKNIKAMVDTFEKRCKNELSEDNKRNLNLLNIAFGAHMHLTNLTTSLLVRTESMIRADKDQYKAIYDKVYELEDDSNDHQHESALFHGEPFNSDTLFDNEDMRDFNRTEWMDLNLTVECYEMKYALTKSMQDLIVNEALILTDDKPNKIARLKALREAEEKKSGGKIATLIDNIRKILQKFISALTPKFNNLAGYIRKYKGQIDKPITFTSNMKSNGDILAGMYRVQGGINIIPFDYNAMKDDLKDKKTFFAKRILPSMNKTVQSSKRNVKWTDDMEVATYCKIYFGASMPQDKYPMCEFTASEMDNNKGNIVRYLTEKNMAFSAKTDLAKLEAESKKINVSAASKAAAKSSDNKDTSNSTSNAAATPASDNDDSKNESMYYSELYQRWITEADIDMGNVAQNAGDTGSANVDNEIFKAFRVYMDTYKDVIFAKMTGAEFVFSELKQLIVMHAVKNGAPKPGPDPVQPQGPAAKN